MVKILEPRYSSEFAQETTTSFDVLSDAMPGIDKASTLTRIELREISPLVSDILTSRPLGLPPPPCILVQLWMNSLMDMSSWWRACCNVLLASLYTNRLVNRIVCGSTPSSFCASWNDKITNAQFKKGEMEWQRFAKLQYSLRLVEVIPTSAYAGFSPFENFFVGYFSMARLDKCQRWDDRKYTTVLTKEFANFGIWYRLIKIDLSE